MNKIIFGEMRDLTKKLVSIPSVNGSHVFCNDGAGDQLSAVPAACYCCRCLLDNDAYHFGVSSYDGSKSE